jgi:hypothetical protein
MEPRTTAPLACHFCDRHFPTAEGLSRHIQTKKSCASKLEAMEMAWGRSQERESTQAGDTGGETCLEMDLDTRMLPSDEPETSLGDPSAADRLDLDQGSISDGDSDFEGEELTHFDTAAGGWDAGGDGGDGEKPTCDGNSRESRFVMEEFPGPAGQPIGVGNSPFNTFLSPPSSSSNPSSPPHSPSLNAHPSVVDPELWELARWLMSSGLTAGARESFFKLKMVSCLFERAIFTYSTLK